MIRRLAILLFVILISWGLFYTGILELKTENMEESSWQPQRAPDVVFERLDGSSISLAVFQGKVVLLNFWATWCPPCIEEFPALLEAVRHYQGEVVLIAVANDTERKDVTRFLKRFEKYRDVIESPSVEIVLDSRFEISNDLFHVYRLPETFLVDRHLMLVKKFVGKMEWGEELQKIIDPFSHEREDSI